MKKFKFARCSKRGEEQTSARNMLQPQTEYSPLILPLVEAPTTAEPCSHWEKKLVSAHPEDLSYEERIELEQHLEICPQCKATLRQDRIMDSFIRQLPFQDQLDQDQLELPPQLKRLWEFEKMQKKLSEDDPKETDSGEHHDLKNTFLALEEESDQQIYQKEQAKKEMILRSIIIYTILFISICSIGVTSLIVLTSSALLAQKVGVLLLATTFVGTILVVTLRIGCTAFHLGKSKDSRLRKRKTFHQTIKALVLL